MAASNPRADALRAALDRAVAGAQIKAYDAANPTGNKLTWTVTPATDDADTLTFDTPQAEAFVAGLRAPRAHRTRTRNPHVEALRKSDSVTVEVPADGDVKRMRNALFIAAYSLGAKGRFKVSTTRNEDGTYTLVGRLT